MTILKNEVAAVLDRQTHYRTAESYYEGTNGEVFASGLMRRVFGDTGYRAHLNFCRPVVDAVCSRLELAAIVASTDRANKIIRDVWDFNELDLDSDEIHRRAEVYGDCYAMVWPDDDGNMEISYNTPLTTTIVYDPESPRKKLYAVKMWQTETGTRMNIYTKDSIKKYYVQNKQASEGSNWNLMETIENPFGEVPVFHFRTERPFGRPGHIDAYESQDYINKQFVTSMTVTDYQGAPQRYALLREGASTEAEDFDDEDTERENSRGLKAGAGEVWFMNGIDKIGQFDPADPKVFWEPIKDTVRAMASLTATPLHYFEKTGNIPSGEALRVAEAPLIKKVDRRKQSFGQTWKDIFRFILKADAVNAELFVKWAEVESLDELERLDVALKKATLGVSFMQNLKELGYDEKVIEEIIAQKSAERAEGQVSEYPNGEEVSNDQSNATGEGDNA